MFVLLSRRQWNLLWIEVNSTCKLIYVYMHRRLQIFANFHFNADGLLGLLFNWCECICLELQYEIYMPLWVSSEHFTAVGYPTFPINSMKRSRFYRSCEFDCTHICEYLFTHMSVSVKSGKRSGWDIAPRLFEILEKNSTTALWNALNRQLLNQHYYREGHPVNWSNLNILSNNSNQKIFFRLILFAIITG